MDMKPWLSRVTGGESVNAIAKKIGMAQKTLDTQLRSASGLKPETVVMVARAYRVSPVAGLVELGLITAKEAGDDEALLASLQMMTAEQALRGAADKEILAEIQRRLDERGRDELAARRGRRQPDPTDDEAAEVDDEPYAAGDMERGTIAEEQEASDTP